MSEDKIEKQQDGLPYMKTRITIAILCIILGVYVYQQGGVVTQLENVAKVFVEHADAGSNGRALSLCLLGAGGLGIYTQIKQWKQGMLISGILCGAGTLFSLNVGIYEDLYIWNTVSAIFSAVLLILFFKINPKEY